MNNYSEGSCLAQNIGKLSGIKIINKLKIK